MTLVIKRGAKPLAWTISSVGQSGRLITDWSRVRVPDGPPMCPCRGTHLGVLDSEETYNLGQMSYWWLFRHCNDA